MKNKEVIRLAALRAVKSALLLEGTKDGVMLVSDSVAISIISRLIKQRKDSATIYTEQKRKHYPELIPTIQECNDFAIESVGNKLTAKGIHGTDKYYRTFSGYKEIFDNLELSG